MSSIKQDPGVSPRAPSTSSRKRRRTDEFDDQASIMTSAAPMDEAQDIPDLWMMPFVVSKDTWAVTRCLEIHGNGKTSAKWSPAHFVAISMWYGGIKAGIQAAKAIRIFGIWSPHVGDKHDELPSMEVKTGPRQILSKIWPTDEYEQKPLLDRANRLSPETPFTNFDEAHNYLLRLCIGPNLADFPTVVRPKLQKYDWTHLISPVQFCRTLVPILQNHFDPKVHLASASEAVVGYAVNEYLLKTYTSTPDLESTKRNQAGGRNASCRGRNREKDVFQTDDNEDDEENFEVGSNRPAAVKSEPGHSDSNSADTVGPWLSVQPQERSDASRSHVKDEQKEHNINATRHAPARSTERAHTTAETQAPDRQMSASGRNNETETKISGPSPLGNSVNDAAATAAKPIPPAPRDPQTLRKQVLNHLMNGKHPYSSPQQSPEIGRKRACLENSQIPRVTSFSGTNDIDMAVEDERDDHDAYSSVGVLDGTYAIETSPPSAADDDRLEEDSGHDGSSNLNPESSPKTSIAALIEHESVNDQDGAPAEKHSTSIRDRAVGTLLTDWPAKAGGLTEDICDLKALKQIMTSNKLNQDHKAMWVSLVQTIIYEPDRNSVLDFLRNTLSGDATLPDSFEDRPTVPRQDVFNLREWAVTGSLRMYGGQKERWSAAHFVDLALWVGGPDAGTQAARALKIFGVWNPFSSFNPAFAIHSIGDCLGYQDILRSIWPDENDGLRLLAWANSHRPTNEQPFDNFAEAHSYLLRQCIGDDLKQFPPLARDPAQGGEVNSRIISRAYFDSTLAPILCEHFDTNVDLELAFQAAVASQGGSLDRNPVKHITPVRGFRPAIPEDHVSRRQEKGKRKQPFDGKDQYDDEGDDSEGHYSGPAAPIKKEHGIKEEFTPDRNRVLPHVWTPKVTRRCLKIIRQVLIEKQTTRLPRREVSRRLQAKYGIYRSATSIGRKWTRQWRQLPEFEEMLAQIRVNNDQEEESDGADEAEDSEGADDPGDERDGTDDADDTDESNESDDAIEDAAEDGLGDAPEDEADEVEDTAQTEEPVKEQSPVPHRQSQNHQYPNTGRTTRRMTRARTEERTTNDLYQKSLDIPAEIIAQFINTGRSSPFFTPNWKEVLNHRTVNGMTAVGLATVHLILLTIPSLTHRHRPSFTTHTKL
ncbi:hypothetical protein KCU65_g4851, partial [Aureobasidium melanogenum]